MAQCFVCNISDKERVLLPCLHEGKEKFVCVRCLPVLIHGGGH
jgi:hypothetical protein